MLDVFSSPFLPYRTAQSNPFGDDATDFDTRALCHDAYHNTVTYLDMSSRVLQRMGKHVGAQAYGTESGISNPLAAAALASATGGKVGGGGIKASEAPEAPEAPEDSTRLPTPAMLPQPGVMRGPPQGGGRGGPRPRGARAGGGGGYERLGA